MNNLQTDVVSQQEFDQATWQALAEDVLAPLLVEHYIAGNSQYFDACYYEFALESYQFPAGRWRSLFASIVTLNLKKESVNWNNLSPLVSSTVSEDWFTSVIQIADGVRLLDFDGNVDKLKALGKRMATAERFERGALELRQGKSLELTISNTVSQITNLSERGFDHETASKAAVNVKAIMEGEPKPGVKTRIPFIDDCASLQTGQMCLLAGAYKSHKTALALNFVIEAYRQGKKPAILSWENSVEMTSMQLICMLAVEYLLYTLRLPYTQKDPVFNIAPALIMEAGKNYKNWIQKRVEAIDYGYYAFEKMGENIRIYDRSKKGGELSDLQSTRTVVSRDMRLYEGDFYLLDHQGLILAPGEIYERTSAVSGGLQELSRVADPHPIHLLVLSQLSEAAIKAKKAYSSGAKGGGDSNANSDVVLRTMPLRDASGGEDKYFDDRVKLQVKHDRWGGSTGFELVYFHPQSGLRLPPAQDLAEEQRLLGSDMGTGVPNDDEPRDLSLL